MNPAPKSSGRRRLLIAPVEISGYATNLQAGFEALGWDVDVLDVSAHQFDYGLDLPKSWVLPKLRRILAKARERSVVAHAVTWIAMSVWQAWFAVARVRKYDAVIYLYGRTVFFGIDARLAKGNGCRIVTVLLGSDGRPSAMNGVVLHSRPTISARQLERMSKRQKKRIRRAETRSDLVITAPGTAHYLTEPAINWFAIGMPAPSMSHGCGETNRMRSSYSEGTPLRVLHAPSHSGAKGTSAILEELQRLGSAVTVQLIRYSAHERVMDAIRSADVVLDQLYADVPLAGLATEAAALGTPVLVFGPAANLLNDYAEPLGVPCGHYFDYTQLRSVLNKAVTDRDWLAELGNGTTTYVRATMAPDSVASRLARLIDGDVPDGWWIDPAEIDYPWGAGLDRGLLLETLGRIVQERGLQTLQLPSWQSTYATVEQMLREHARDASGTAVS